MRPAELASRLADALCMQGMRMERLWRFKRPQESSWRQYTFCTARTAQLPSLPMDFSPSDADIQRLLAGEWGALGFAWRWEEGPDRWHIAPDSGRRWPRRFFASIAYRAGNPTGDARVVWEPARLQGLLSLALLVTRHPTHRQRACELLERVLDSWVQGNPYLTGVHYLSAMECALRLIAVCHAFDMARQSLRQHVATWAHLTWLMESHAIFIRRRLSRHSSSGNHTIAECVGLIYAGTLFPEHPRADEWLDTGLALLSHEASRQVLPDGGGIEQTLWYHLFVLDLLGLVPPLLESRGKLVPREISAALTRGRAFLNKFGRAPRELPSIGDSDGGYALSPHLRLSFAPGREVRMAEVVTFTDSGYTLVRPRGRKDLRVVIDHGPLGMPPAFGHGHADALSVVISSNGQDLLTDPGTCGYALDPLWRRYFKSTRAHNTVTVDGLDQARQQGAFLWSAPYRAELMQMEEVPPETIAHLLLRHDGYRDRGVIHWRTIVIQSDGIVRIADELEGVGEHELELNWHLGVEPVSSNIQRGELAFADGTRLRVYGGHCTLHRGETDPIRGWSSRVYGCKTPIDTLRIVWRGVLPHKFATFVVPNALQVDCNIEPKDSRSGYPWRRKELKSCPSPSTVSTGAALSRSSSTIYWLADRRKP